MLDRAGVGSTGTRAERAGTGPAWRVLAPAQLGEPCLQRMTAAVAGVVGGWGRGQGRVTVAGAG